MYEIPCRCGKVKQNYKMNIGPFFINDCCIEAGYNHLGEMIKKEKVVASFTQKLTAEMLPGESQEDTERRITEEFVNHVIPDLTQSEEVQQEAEKLEIIDDPALDAQEESESEEQAEAPKVESKKNKRNKKDKV